MIVDKHKILVEWAYRTKSGKPNPKSMAHQIILEVIELAFTFKTPLNLMISRYPSYPS